MCWNSAKRWGCVVEIYSTHWSCRWLPFTGTRHEWRKCYCVNVRYRKRLLCSQDQFCSINVQKKQLNRCFRELAVELHENESGGMTDSNRSAKATVKQVERFINSVSKQIYFSPDWGLPVSLEFSLQNRNLFYIAYRQCVTSYTVLHLDSQICLFLSFFLSFHEPSRHKTWTEDLMTGKNLCCCSLF